MYFEWNHLQNNSIDNFHWKVSLLIYIKMRELRMITKLTFHRIWVHFELKQHYSLSNHILKNKNTKFDVGELYYYR
jgi:hypothetical protein